METETEKQKEFKIRLEELRKKFKEEQERKNWLLPPLAEVIQLVPKKTPKKDIETMFCEPCEQTGKLIKVREGVLYVYRCPCPAGDALLSIPVWNDRIKKETKRTNLYILKKPVFS